MKQSMLHRLQGKTIFGPETAVRNAGNHDGNVLGWQRRKGNTAVTALSGSPTKTTYEDVSGQAQKASDEASRLGTRDSHLTAQAAQIAAQRFAEGGGARTARDASFHAQKAEYHLKQAFNARQ